MTEKQKSKYELLKQLEEIKEFICLEEFFEVDILIENLLIDITTFQEKYDN